MDLYIDFLTPGVFDVFVIVNIALGVLIAGRRFVKDIRGSLPEDAPGWASIGSDASSASSSSIDS